MIIGTKLVFIYWTAGLSFDFPLLKYCSHIACGAEDCPSGARNGFSVAGNVMEAQVRGKW